MVSMSKLHHNEWVGVEMERFRMPVFPPGPIALRVKAGGKGDALVCRPFGMELNLGT